MAIYFPVKTESARIKQHFLTLKERTGLVLQKIVGLDVDEQISEIDAKLLQATKPMRFWGSEGVEAKSVVEFEDVCIALSQHVNKDPKSMTVLEFYRTLEIVQKRIRQQEKQAGKRRS